MRATSPPEVCIFAYGGGRLEAMNRLLTAYCVLQLLLATVPVNGQSPVVPENNASQGSPDIVADSLKRDDQRQLHEFVVTYCLDCHDGTEEGRLSLQLEQLKAPSETPATWEKMLRRLRTRQMPPPTATRPDESTYRQMTEAISSRLDAHALRHPNPGREEAIRTLTRFEYQNAIRDLLKVKIDARRWLPKDSSSHGFDNVTTAALTPLRLDRYLTAARNASQLALGRPGLSSQADTFRVAADRSQDRHLPGLPLGTRGGILVDYQFPVTGEYQVTVRLARDRNEEVEGLYGKHEMLVLLDRKQEQRFEIEPPQDKDYSKVDQHLRATLHVEGGSHQLGVTFVKKPRSIIETRRQPFDAQFNMHRHPRQSPAVFEVSVVAIPHRQASAATPSRRWLLDSIPDEVSTEEESARRILKRILRLAYRRPIEDSDLERPMEFFHAGRDEEDQFEAGIERALTAILASPHFFLRVEHDQASQAANGSADSLRRVTDIELATRLSFFLWSSIPDDELLSLAESDTLSEPKTLSQQVERMLLDPRADALITNFGSQWLYLRNLDSISADLRRFPDFDDNLRQAFRNETQALLREVFMNDRPLVELITADFTFLNERLAQHYGIATVRGSRFRRVNHVRQWHRGGLLRNGSIQMVTSYATRTSPVLRGNWVLENLLGTPAPPPPPNVPTLEDNTVDASLPIRARLASHRANIACAVCHDLIDPVGFALENFDAIGRWRDFENGHPVDSNGGLPDGAEFEGVGGLEDALASRPDLLAHTLTEKLLTYALGRGIESYDQPAIRKIVSDAASNDYRFADLVEGIVFSVPFQMRSTR